MYDEALVEPMRRELTDLGISEARSADAVNQFINQDKTTLVVINSVCGCAAANARPAVAIAMRNSKTPDQAFTVFAGNDAEATNRVREILVGYPPSSPNIALFKGGEVVCNIERHQIEGRSAQDIAADLASAFDANC